MPWPTYPKLATVQKGIYLHAYVIIDLFSRFVVGWMVAECESQHLAAQLFSEAIARHKIEPGITVHSDRGSAMKSDTLAQLLATLGASHSFSRPRVSDDNPYSEAQFKTLKYQPDYPGKFASTLDARAWLEPFFGWHNDEHHHGGLALYTPAEVFEGRVEQVRKIRQTALDCAYALHPNRFPNGPPIAALPPVEVAINPITSDVIELLQNTQSEPVKADPLDPSSIAGAHALVCTSDEPRAAQDAPKPITPRAARSRVGPKRHSNQFVPKLAAIPS